jgi:trimethylamine:corrinoid methyltransferase-like protein
MHSGEVYISDFDTRESYESWSESGKPTLLEEVKDLIKDTLASHETLPLDEDVERELSAIEERARKASGSMQPKG